MNRNWLIGFAIILCFGDISGTARAESVVQVWLCDLKGGFDRQEVLSLSADWLQAVRQIEGGKFVQAHVEFPLVSDNTCDFKFVIKADSIKSWGALSGRLHPASGEFLQSVLGDIADKWDNIAICSSSSLWATTDIE